MDDTRVYFRESAPSVKTLGAVDLPRGRTNPEGSLRRAQLAAAFAVGAHFSVNREPAIVSMPTGTGKSAAMTLLPFVLSARRVLVVVPSKLLRAQLAAEFAALSVLRRVSLVPSEMLPPQVTEVEKRITTADAWVTLSDFDVVVATPNVLSPAYDEVAVPPPGMFDLVIFDEAHHTPAPTYAAVRAAFPDALAALFTATPFRRDRHPLPGVAVYSYGLAQALDEGVLSPVTFLPVEVSEDADQRSRDEALARAAAARIADEVHVRADSRIIARTSSVAHAKELIAIYRRAGLHLGLVTASTTRKALRETFASVRDGALAGFISVGVLGEGFDFPQLKIGVYHQRHASLPATLQFLGRISRIVPEGVTAELLAVREEVSDETRELYASDVAWAALVPALSDAATQSEVQRREYVRSFDPTPVDPLSLAALRPRKDVQVFELTPGQHIDVRAQIARLAGGDVVYQGADEAGVFAVVITELLDRPEWLDADTLDRYRFELHVVFHDVAHNLLFVHGTRDESILELLQAMGCSAPQTVDPVWLDRLLTSIAIADYHSVGMRSVRAAGGRLAAYRMMAGSSVGAAVMPSETRNYGTGHAIARVRDPMTVTAADVAAGTATPSNITSLGVSYGRGKVFSPDLAVLLDFRRWCERLAELVDAQGAAVPAGPPALALLSPRRIVEFPDGAYLAAIEPMLIGQGYRIVDTETGVVTPLEEAALSVEKVSATALRLQVETPEGQQWHGVLDRTGRVAPGDLVWMVQSPALPTQDLHEFLERQPPTIFYTSGESSMGGILFQASAEYPDLQPPVVETWSFDTTDIRAEHTGARDGLLTVKDTVLAAIGDDVGYVVDDDRAAETADLVVIGNAMSGRVREVQLVHLKASSEEAPGGRVEDLYDLLGQATRSVVWCDVRRLAARLLDRLTSGSTVVRGDPHELRTLLASWAATPVPIRWTITVVQPGLLAGRVNGSRNIKIMLNDLVEWVAQHDAQTRIVVHS